MAEKTVGIIGGMGPEATIDLMQRILRLTPAPEDRDMEDIDHIRCLVDNNPKIPSRIKAIIDKDGIDPGPFIADMAKGLESWGADFLAIPCNTAHYYYDIIQSAVNIPVINLIDLVCNHVKTNFSDNNQTLDQTGNKTKNRTKNKIGILASTAVKITKLYSKNLAQFEIQDVWPDPDHQAILLKVIKEIKKRNMDSKVQNDYAQVCDNLLQKGVNTAIIACTELSILKGKTSINTVDAAEILAMEVVRQAVNKQ
ncbi:MAG: amino acid racemase [Deltaproteobacteria bacterium]|jgi:aspartate racemase|nr:amino acid racemase [Deltaproteobacteria bacterium]